MEINMEQSNQYTEDCSQSLSEETSFEDYLNELSCRICLTPCADTGENIASYAEIYAQTTEFAVYANDVPQKICSQCKNELLAASNFRQKCKETEAKLSKYFAESFEVQIDFEPLPEKTESEKIERRGRPRTRPPKIARPIGRPKGTTKDKIVVGTKRLGRPPGSTSKEVDSPLFPGVTVKQEFDALEGLRGNLPSSTKGTHGRPKQYRGDGEKIVCHVCARVFLESERKNMYNHMHKHRVEARQAQKAREAGGATESQPVNAQITFFQ